MNGYLNLTIKLIVMIKGKTLELHMRNPIEKTMGQMVVIRAEFTIIPAKTGCGNKFTNGSYHWP